jgi:hypothetical protein
LIVLGGGAAVRKRFYDSVSKTDESNIVRTMNGGGGCGGGGQRAADLTQHNISTQ